MNQSLEEKQATLRKLSLEVQDLEEKERVTKQYPKMVAMKGTFWKYRNCYSCPQDPSDYWWLYRNIIDVKQDCTMITNEFQIDKYGELSVKTNHNSIWYENSGWIKASKQEWKKALDKVNSIIKALSV